MGRPLGKINPNGPAKGVSRSPGTRQVVCRFDDEQFEDIQARATAENTSFAEQVRLLCEWGLETAKGDQNGQ